MNYHIMVQDKFLDSYIEDIYAINEEANNVFWFRGNKGQNGYVNTSRSVEYIGNDFNLIRERLAALRPDDAIFIHWYDSIISKVLYSLPNPLYVMLWGGEFYNQPFWHHRWVYDRKTLNYLKRYNSIPKIRFTFNLLNLYRNAKRVYFFHREIQNSYRTKNDLIGRIDYLITPTTADYLKIKQLYPSFRAKFISGFYDQNFDRAYTSSPLGMDSKNGFNILLGNSGAPSNNHLEALKKLSKISGANITIYCPLSYGGHQEYVDLIVTKGKNLFGERFIPVVNFMERDEYMRFFDKIDIVLMYHNRQQAFGNICAALTKGKAVFLKKQNTLKDHFDGLQIKTYDAMRIDAIDLGSAIAESRNSRSLNCEILKANLSREKRLEDLQTLMIGTRNQVDNIHFFVKK